MACLGGGLTLKHGAHLPPGRHAALAGVLAHGGLQEEQGDTTEEEEYEVGDEEHTCPRRHNKKEKR